MKNEQNNKELESLTKRIRFKSLPFDEKQMSDRLSDRVKRPVIISYTGKENSAWKYLSIAVSIALLLVTGILLTDKEPEQELVYYETIAVPDAKTKITLPDSSIVWLNANACLRYPREFSEQVRQVETHKAHEVFIRKLSDKCINIYLSICNILKRIPLITCK